ncbi:Os02g0548900, partial [Oryza sativa Japonica Group]
WRVSGDSGSAPVSSEAAEEDGGLDDILSKLDIQVTPTLVLYGSGALVVLWVLSSVVSAIDSIPLLCRYDIFHQTSWAAVSSSALIWFSVINDKSNYVRLTFL